MQQFEAYIYIGTLSFRYFAILNLSNVIFSLISLKMTTNPIQFDLTIRKDKSGNQYQHLKIRLENHIQPDTLKNVSIPELNPNIGLVIEGQAPNWLYAYIARQCSSLAWVGCYYLDLEAAIVIKTNVPEINIGQAIPITLSQAEILKGATRSDLEKQLKNLKSSEKKLLQSPKVLNGQINLSVNNSLPHQQLVIDAVDIAPQTLSTLCLPKELDLSREIVLYGSASTWLYCYLVERCQEAPCIACHNIWNGAVIVESKDRDFPIGHSFKLVEKIPGSTIIIGGIPDSGKSVLTYALEQTLNHNGYNNRVHTLRAHWDGHGDWYLSMLDRNKADIHSISVGNPRKTPEEKKAFFKKQAELTEKLRSTMDLAIVDFGGYFQESDLVLVQRCTHYIIICKCPDKAGQDEWREAIDKWHNFFGKKGRLKPLAVIYSVWEDKLEVITTEPYLEIVAGKWEAGVTTIPDILLQEVIKLFKEKSE